MKGNLAGCQNPLKQVLAAHNISLAEKKLMVALGGENGNE
jgi:hypothetical protein